MVDCRTYLKIRKNDRPVKLIQHALQLSLPALYKDPRELASQLVGGRLSMRYDEKLLPEILQVVKQAEKYRPDDGDGNGKKIPVWMPITRSLTPAGHPCLAVLEGDAQAACEADKHHDQMQ